MHEADENQVLIQFGKLLRSDNADAKSIHMAFLKQKADNPNDINLMATFIAAARKLI